MHYPNAAVISKNFLVSSRKRRPGRYEQQTNMVTIEVSPGQVRSDLALRLP